MDLSPSVLRSGSFDTCRGTKFPAQSGIELGNWARKSFRMSELFSQPWHVKDTRALYNKTLYQWGILKYRMYMSKCRIIETPHSIFWPKSGGGGPRASSNTLYI